MAAKWNIRAFTHIDTEEVVELALRAWAPVFKSFETVLGTPLYLHMFPDWQTYQSSSVRDALAKNESWVVADAERIAGFVNVIVKEDVNEGEIYMIAVDPNQQKQRLGAMLTEFAVQELERCGVDLVTVGTGGDPGHLAARRTYEAAGFTPFPQVTYYKLLKQPK